MVQCSESSLCHRAFKGTRSSHKELIHFFSRTVCRRDAHRVPRGPRGERVAAGAAQSELQLGRSSSQPGLCSASNMAAAAGTPSAAAADHRAQTPSALLGGSATFASVGVLGIQPVAASPPKDTAALEAEMEHLRPPDDGLLFKCSCLALELPHMASLPASLASQANPSGQRESHAVAGEPSRLPERDPPRGSPALEAGGPSCDTVLCDLDTCWKQHHPSRVTPLYLCVADGATLQAHRDRDTALDEHAKLQSRVGELEAALRQERASTEARRARHILDIHGIHARH